MKVFLPNRKPFENASPDVKSALGFAFLLASCTVAGLFLRRSLIIAQTRTFGDWEWFKFLFLKGGGLLFEAWAVKSIYSGATVNWTLIFPWVWRIFPVYRDEDTIGFYFGVIFLCVAGYFVLVFV